MRTSQIATTDYTLRHSWSDVEHCWASRVGGWLPPSTPHTQQLFAPHWSDIQPVSVLRASEVDKSSHVLYLCLRLLQTRSSSCIKLTSSSSSLDCVKWIVMTVRPQDSVDIRLTVDFVNLFVTISCVWLWKCFLRWRPPQYCW